MKTFVAQWARPALFIILSVFLMGGASAQSKKQVKEAKKAAEIKELIDAQSYIFTAEYVQPMRGGNHYITPDYDLTVGKDSLISYLPYFGRAYVAPIDPTQGGIKFTTTKFEYKTVESKNGWDISIKVSDANDVRRLTLSVSKSGYATLYVTSNNREAISYQGYIQAKKQKA